MKHFSLFFLALLVMFLSCKKEEFSTTTPINAINKNAQELPTSVIEKMLDFYIKELATGEKTRTNSYITFKNKGKKYYSISSNSTTRGNITVHDSIAVYNYSIDNGTDEGYAIVINDNRFPCVLSYTPNGTLEDTLYNNGLKEWVNTIPQSIESMYNKYYISTYNNQQNNDNKTRNPVKDPPLEKPFPIAKDSIFLGNTWITWWYEIYLKDAWFTCRLCDFYKENLISTQWNQITPYNNKMHEISCSGTNKKVYTGCTTTALSQILAYYEYPPKYNWALLKQSSRIYNTSDPAQINEVAQLMKDLQDLLKPIKFECDGTTITRNDLLSTLNRYFRYDTSANFNYRNNSLPVLKCGSSPSGIGHAYIIDGFASSSFAYVGYPQIYKWSIYDRDTGTYHDEYWDPTPEEKNSRLYWEIHREETRAAWHINWGWGGSSDGWFIVDDGGSLYNKNNFYIYNFQRK